MISAGTAYRQQDTSRHGHRRYSDEAVEQMVHMRSVEKKPIKEIAEAMGITPRAVERQLESYGSLADEGPLRAPPFDGWDFSNDNIGGNYA